jgi:hypothetical protein
MHVIVCSGAVGMISVALVLTSHVMINKTTLPVSGTCGPGDLQAYHHQPRLLLLNQTNKQNSVTILRNSQSFNISNGATCCGNHNSADKSYCLEPCTLVFRASMTAEKSSSARPSDFATLYSSFAAATVGMDWDTDSASANASLRSCIELYWLSTRNSGSGQSRCIGNCFPLLNAGQTTSRSRGSYLLLMFQRKSRRICSFNHRWALQGEHRSTDSTL